MKLFLTTACLCLSMTLIGCSEPQSTNVAKDADQAKIDEYNRLNEQAMAELEADEAAPQEEPKEDDES